MNSVALEIEIKGFKNILKILDSGVVVSPSRESGVDFTNCLQEIGRDAGPCHHFFFDVDWDCCSLNVPVFLSKDECL